MESYSIPGYRGAIRKIVLWLSSPGSSPRVTQSRQVNTAPFTPRGDLLYARQVKRPLMGRWALSGTKVTISSRSLKPIYFVPFIKSLLQVQRGFPLLLGHEVGVAHRHLQGFMSHQLFDGQDGFSLQGEPSGEGVSSFESNIKTGPVFGGQVRRGETVNRF